MEEMLTYGSLFAGIGGFDLGFENAGMNCLWKVEKDKHCRMVLEYHDKETEIFEDVKNVGKRNLKPVDIICAGVPCQDVSVAGKRKGLAGERTGLFFEFERIVSELQPEWLVFENVPGLLSSNERRDFATILGRLGECGYLQAYRVLNSQYWGVTQRRRRVFIVGHLGGSGAIQVLFESEGLPWNPQKGRKKREGLAGTLEARTKSGGPSGDECQNLIAATETGAGYWTEGKPRLRATTAPSQPQTIIVEQNNMVSTPDMISLRSNPAQPVIAIRTANTQANGIGVSEEISHTIDGAQGQAVAFKQNTRNELIESSMHPSLNSGGGKLGQGYPCVRQGVSVRRLTPKECERLQGFPDNYTKYGIDETGKTVEMSDTQRYRQLGNAVTVSVSQWIGKRIVKVYKDK